jgi:hypothetical protein
MVLAVGNHDLGVNSVPLKTVETNEKTPLFKIYFPQHYPMTITEGKGDWTYEKRVPMLRERKTFFTHSIGNTTALLALDSGYEEMPDGIQGKWIDKTLDMYSNYPVKMATYHSPIYHSCVNHETEVLVQQYLAWVPFFDKHSLTIGLENHVHSFKRTYPLRNGLRNDANGVVYIGDGKWGPASDNTELTHNPEIFVKNNLEYHVWLLDMYADRIEMSAINEKGIIFDNSTIALNNGKKDHGKLSSFSSTL